MALCAIQKWHLLMLAAALAGAGCKQRNPAEAARVDIVFDGR